MSGDLQPGQSKRDKKEAKKAAKEGPAVKGSEDVVWKDGKFMFPLRKPIIAYDEELKELALREPGSEDILAVGNPVKVNMMVDPPDVQFDDKRMAAMLAQLATVPVSSIGKLHPQDFVALCWIITPFFLPA